jgi:rhodanese-related sulfurtransferase
MDFLTDNWMLVGIALLAGGALLWDIVGERLAGMPRLTPAQAVQLINRENAAVVDLRSTEVFARGHIAGAVNLPATRLSELATRLGKVGGRPLVLVSDGNAATMAAARALRTAGGDRLHLLAGGMTAWREAGLPVRS